MIGMMGVCWILGLCWVAVVWPLPAPRPHPRPLSRPAGEGDCSRWRCWLVVGGVGGIGGWGSASGPARPLALTPGPSPAQRERGDCSRWRCWLVFGGVGGIGGWRVWGLGRMVVFGLGWWLGECFWPLVPCIPRSLRSRPFRHERGRGVHERCLRGGPHLSFGHFPRERGKP